MPGIGGGSRGGGGHGGGHGGGGYRGGGGHGGPGRPGGPGYGGPGMGFHGRPPRPPRHHWWFFGPRYGYGYYGFGGGLVSLIMLPVIMVLLAVLVLVFMLISAFGAVSEGGVISYDARSFQDYAMEQYDVVYANTDAYEDNILIVFLTSENADEYYYIAVTGNDINRSVDDLFGAEGTALGNALYNNINVSGYWHTLDRNLAGAVTDLTSSVNRLGLDSNFAAWCTDRNHTTRSVLVNRSSFSISATEVERALADFTAQTGISISIVVDDMEDVLKTDYSGMIIGIVLIAILLIGAGVFLWRGIKARRMAKNNGNGYNNNNNGYNDSFNNYNDFNGGGYYR